MLKEVKPGFENGAGKVSKRVTRVRIKKEVALVSKLPPSPPFPSLCFSLWGCHVVGQQEGQTGPL